MSDKKSIKSSTTKKPTFKTKTQFFNARLTKTKITLRQIAECGQHGILDEDLEGNAEIDSFNYMHCLIEGFRVLGGLHWALDVYLFYFFRDFNFILEYSRSIKSRIILCY